MEFVIRFGKPVLFRGKEINSLKVEVEPLSLWDAYKVALVIDGEVVDEAVMSSKEEVERYVMSFVEYFD